MHKRQLLVINPNTSVATTERLRQVLIAVPHDVELVFKTATFGANYIACEASHAVAAHAALDVWARYCGEQCGEQCGEKCIENGGEQSAQPRDQLRDETRHETRDETRDERCHERPDEPRHLPLAGVLIACFGDPGLFALRESCACPVTGLAEASFIEPAQHGGFAIVTGGERWRPMLHRLALSLGFAPLLKHIEIVQPTGAQLQADPAMALQCLGQACQAAAVPGVKSIIMGGAGLAGYAAALEATCPVRLIDSASAGLKVLLENRAPPAQQKANGFVAAWSGVSAGMQRLTAP